ncbi:glycosyltransferase [Rubrobacter indicoceani]|uniref:glycosyltransferase n=1 Tax=Rubrobacter indicoceani TaxID=2051957 RepID=UPI000E5C3219|nr:glycosyltransferase [Rubrobacter indicoceani]
MNLETGRRLPPVYILSGIRWGFLWQRHQTLATHFARAGYPTVFVETTGLRNPSRLSARSVAFRLLGRPVREPDPGGPSVYSPLVLPPGGKPSRKVNERFLVPRVARDLLGGFGRAPVIVAYPPTKTTLQIISRLSPRLVYYDCSEEYAAMEGVPEDIASTELEMILRADLVSCTSETLLDRISGLRPDAFYLGPGVEYERFAPVGPAEPSLNREAKTVCYFGDVSPERLEVGCLSGIADAGHTVRLVGEVRGGARVLLRHPNVDYRGAIEHRELARNLAGADAIVLPYRESALTAAITPAKLYESLATGLPLISTPLPSLKRYIECGLIYPARKAEEYLGTLGRLAGTENKALVEKRRRTAEYNSWKAVFSRMEGEIWRELAHSRKAGT